MSIGQDRTRDCESENCGLLGNLAFRLFVNDLATNGL